MPTLTLYDAVGGRPAVDAVKWGLVGDDRELGKCRVLHVSQPASGGVAKVVRQLALDQAQAGLDISVACPRALADEVESSDQRISTYEWTATRNPGPGLIRECRRLRQIVDTLRPDIVHLHSSKAGLVGRIVCRPDRAHIIFQPHAWSFQAGDTRLRAVSRLWERLAATRTSAFVFVSEDEKLLAPFERGRSRLIPNGVDAEQFLPMDKHEARARIGVPDRPTVACVGRVCFQKGQDRLIARWPEIAGNVPEAQLIIVGDGPGAAEMMAETDSPAVYWLGDQSNLNPYYAAADVVALPSRWEGMALVPLEAMAAGRPVVSFDVGGARATLADSGIVVQSDAEFVKRLTDMLNREGSACELGRRARDRVIEHFRVEIAAERVREVYAEVIR